MSHEFPAYGLWSLVIINSLVFIIFAFSFSHPYSKGDWRSFGAFSAFVVALFAEMYGFPLTIFLLYGWLSDKFPGVDPLSHASGHLWYTLSGSHGDPHATPIHLLSNLLILAGFIVLASAWRTLYGAQRRGIVASSGLYSRVRHPQYIGFMLIMLGFLFQWPTIVTILMFPVLVMMYARLARKEEDESRERFGPMWDEYVSRTRAWIPWFRGSISRRKLAREPMRGMPGKAGLVTGDEAR